MNVVILAIIVIVVLIIVLIILVGGTSQFIKVVKDIVSGRVSAQSAELSTRDCEQLCDSAKALANPALQSQSAYCTKTYVISVNNQLTKVNCGSTAKAVVVSSEEKSKGISESPQSLGVNCDITCAAA